METTLDEIQKLQAKLAFLTELEQNKELETNDIGEYYENFTYSITEDIPQIIEDEIIRLDNLIPVIKNLEKSIKLTNKVTIVDRKLTLDKYLTQGPKPGGMENIMKDIKMEQKYILSYMNNFTEDIVKYRTEEYKYKKTVQQRNKLIIQSIEFEFLEKYEIYNNINNYIIPNMKEIKLLNTTNIDIIILQIIIFNKTKQNELDEILKKEISIEMIERKLNFLLNEKLKIIRPIIY